VKQISIVLLNDCGSAAFEAESTLQSSCLMSAWLRCFTPRAFGSAMSALGQSLTSALVRQMFASDPPWRDAF